MTLPQREIEDCKIGDIVEWQPHCETLKPYLAIIIGETIRGTHWRWKVQRLHAPNSDNHPFLIKKIATNWKKIA